MILHVVQLYLIFFNKYFSRKKKQSSSSLLFLLTTVNCLYVQKSQEKKFAINEWNQCEFNILLLFKSIKKNVVVEMVQLINTITI